MTLDTCTVISEIQWAVIYKEFQIEPTMAYTLFTYIQQEDKEPGAQEPS